MPDPTRAVDRGVERARAAAPPMRHDVVCMSTNHWSGLPTSKQSLMREMSRSVRVLYVEPPIDLFSTLGRRRRWPKLRGIRRVHANLWVLSTIGLSASSDPTARARDIGRGLPRVDAAIRRLGLSNHVLWCFAPEHAVCAGRLGERCVVYSAADEPAAFSRRPDVTRSFEQKMLEAADLVFVVSQALLDARAEHPDVYRLPNAADVPHFKRVLAGDSAVSDDRFVEALETAPRPADLPRTKGPIIMYGGAAYQWFDFDLVSAVATARPAWTIVLVGPGGGSEVLPSNVVRLGRRPYARFPEYVAACDVAVIPWRDGLFARHADPIVLYQYLLCGKPVVATPFPAARERGSLVETADDVEGFVSAIEHALETRGDERLRAERMAFALANTWSERANEAARLIEAAVRRRSRGADRLTVRAVSAANGTVDEETS